jgi:hypothetical protein
MSGHFDGYVEVHRKDEVAVMEALLKHGPLAVGVDATYDEFLFFRLVDCYWGVGVVEFRGWWVEGSLQNRGSCRLAVGLATAVMCFSREVGRSGSTEVQ